MCTPVRAVVFLTSAILNCLAYVFFVPGSFQFEDEVAGLLDDKSVGRVLCLIRSRGIKPRTEIVESGFLGDWLHIFKDKTQSRDSVECFVVRSIFFVGLLKLLANFLFNT
ncbi:MAG: hypothetical protein A3H28_14650 [Acidobacteria bacterium RIFCSPLOWO2_02_FULL_61_28]|nr:MAG: hypothetical protein A3H28_14650 [Acidobacteria bacterium RIFCSPLOWO2_02_FULL_61_28]